MTHSGHYITLGFTAAAMLLSWFYFRHYRITRPPIGTFNLLDVAFMTGGVILVPYLYLLTPVWLVAGLLFIGTVSILYFAWEPVLRVRWMIWLISLALPGADLAAGFLLGTKTRGFFAINNILVSMIIAGLANLWVQSGMKARDAAILAAVLAVYDLVATSLLPVMAELITRLEGLPLTPQIAWPVNSYGLWVGIGLGDVLLASVFPLIMRKAFGRLAGILALLIDMSAIVTLFIIPFEKIFPAMVVLGPLMVLQYIYWRRRQGQERTMCQYWQAKPL